MHLSFSELDTNTERPLIEEFLAKHSDPFADLSVWAAARSGPPMSAWVATREREIVALSSLCEISATDNRVFWSVKGRTKDAEHALIKHLVSTGTLQRGVTVCPAHLTALYQNLGVIVYQKTVNHMGMQLTHGPRLAVNEDVIRPTLEELGAFYVKWHNTNWHEGQYFRGPYVAIRQEGALVAAFGTQAVFQGVVHIGNAFVDPAYRGQGLFKKCLAGMLAAIAQEAPGAKVSLYVGEEAAFTREVYERFGFSLRHRLTELEWNAHA